VPAGVGVDVRLAWEPVWNPEMMSDEAKRLLGWN
jgi:metal-sulfur cluster biosynthetic enzyme